MNEISMCFENFLKAERLEKEGKNEEAIVLYTNFISVSESFVPKLQSDVLPIPLKEKLALAYNNRGFIKYLQVEFKSAVEDYTKALFYDSSLAVAHYNRGLIRYRLGCFTEAVQDMNRCLSLKPDFEPAQQCLQQSLKDLQRTCKTERQCSI